jgi:hypothetical protein
MESQGTKTIATLLASIGEFSKISKTILKKSNELKNSYFWISKLTPKVSIQQCGNAVRMDICSHMPHTY